MTKTINTVPIRISELEDIQKTMINLINTFPELPPQIKKGGILFEQLRPREISMCLSSLPSPIRLKTYICGSYTARYPFKVILQTMSTSNSQRINSSGILSKLGEWFEGRTLTSESGETYAMGEFPEMSDGRNITSIYRTNCARLVERLAPNIEITEARFAAEYFVKTDF